MARKPREKVVDRTVTHLQCSMDLTPANTRVSLEAFEIYLYTVLEEKRGVSYILTDIFYKHILQQTLTTNFPRLESS